MYSAGPGTARPDLKPRAEHGDVAGRGLASYLQLFSVAGLVCAPEYERKIYLMATDDGL